MDSSTSLRWTWPSGRTLPSNSIIFVLEWNLVRQLKMPSPTTRLASKPCKRNSQIQLTFEVMMRSTKTSEFLKQRTSCIRPTLTLNSARSRRHQTISATSWRTQPRQAQSQIITSVVFINMKMGSKHGDFSDFVIVEVIVLAPTPCCRTSWPLNDQNNISIISFEHGWKR